MTKRICSIPWCKAKHAARGWCTKHYQRWLKYGDPLYLPPPRPLPTHQEVLDDCYAALERRRKEASE